MDADSYILDVSPPSPDGASGHPGDMDRAERAAPPSSSVRQVVVHVVRRASSALILGVCGLAGAYATLYALTHWLPLNIHFDVSLTLPPHN